MAARLSAAPPTSQGNNLSDDFSCGLDQGGDLPGLNPLIAALGNNGGAVATHALLSGSPAIDTGANVQCPATDARGVARPYDGDANGSAVCDIGAFEARPRVVVTDATVTEGNSGATAAAFTVTLSPASAAAIVVNYATVNRTAAAPGDYTTASGALTFSPGQTSKTISVNVLGDTVDEGTAESFTRQLSSPANATLADGQAARAITDDDEARLAMQASNAQVVEGDSGVTPSPSRLLEPSRGLRRDGELRGHLRRRCERCTSRRGLHPYRWHAHLRAG